MSVPVISYDTLKILIETKGDYILIDVRKKEELNYGHIPSSHNIPLDELKEAFSLESEAFKTKYGIAKPHKTDSIILYCRSGSRSEMATMYLRNLGYDASNYSGSILEWSQHDPNVQAY